MVFHDKALLEMVEVKPQNLAAFGKISGVGQAKLEKYGEKFLAVINGVAA
jgi:ATP-dependent DNA helicase RecQ